MITQGMSGIIAYIIMGSVFMSVFMLILCLFLPRVVSNASKTTLERVEYYGAGSEPGSKKVSAFKRTFSAFSSKILGTLRKVLPKNLVDSVRERLELAGIQDNVRIDIFLSFKFFMPFIFLFLLTFLVLFFKVPLALRMVLVVLVPVSYLFPDYYLKSRTSQRQDEIRRSLPNALDLLTISVEAGLGFDQALIKVSNNIKGPLGIEFKRTIKEIEIGIARKEALRNLSKRTDVPELNAFIMSIIQADIFGISVGKVLRVQAAEMRIKRRQIAEEKGMKAPTKLVFPTILFLFPALMVIILGPAGIRIIETLKIIGK